MLKNGICIIVIGQAVLKILHSEVDILRKRPRIRICLYVSIKGEEQ